MKTRTLFVSFVASALLAPFVTVSAGNQPSESPAYWWWDDTSAVGNTRLVRSPGGLTATFATTGLPAGHVMTMWIMFFDNPAACATSPCTLADAENPLTGFDFHYGGGHVVSDNKTTISGHVRVGELSTSGWAEVGVPELASPLTNPFGADVILAIHSHGPAATGAELVAQASSYLGGCQVFLGPGGFASGFADIPANPGECSTIQLATH